MDAKTLNTLPHHTQEDLEAIPHVTLHVRADAPNLPAFLRGSQILVFHPERRDEGWFGFHRMPRTGDFFALPKLFPDSDYEIIS